MVPMKPILSLSLENSLLRELQTVDVFDGTNMKKLGVIRREFCVCVRTILGMHLLNMYLCCCTSFEDYPNQDIVSYMSFDLDVYENQSLD